MPYHPPATAPPTMGEQRQAMLELEGEALQARKEELLDLCRWMRDWLRNEGGLKMISEDFPIEEFSEAVTMTLTRAQARAREVEEEVVGQEEGEEEDRPHVVTHMTAIKGEDVLARGVEPVLTCEPSTFLGYCRVAHDDWECSTLVDALQGDLSFCSKRYWEQPVLVARRWRCEEVRVRLTRRDNPNHLLDVQSVLMTFLHELAHSATPGVFVNQPDVKVIGRGGSIKPQPGKGRKSERRLREEKKTFVFDSHSEVFYSRFARILRAAEKTGLLRFPIHSDKFSLKNLRRLDAWDLESSPLSRDYSSRVEDFAAHVAKRSFSTSSSSGGVVGSSGTTSAHSSADEEGTSGEEEQEQGDREAMFDAEADRSVRLVEPLRVTFRHRSKGEKVALLPPSACLQGITPLRSLFDQAIQKYGKRTVRRFLTLNGEPVDTNQAVMLLPQGSVLLVVESKGKGIPRPQLLKPPVPL